MGRGGKREGAGRPKCSCRVNLMVRISCNNKAWIIETAKKYNLTFTEVMNMILYIMKFMEEECKVNIYDVFKKITKE